MNAQQLKNAILQEAIEGRLVPQDPNDEPASALLARIRKEKEELVKAGKLKKKDLEVKPISEDEIPFEIPETWEWVRLKAISRSITDGDHMPPPKADSGIPFLVISNIIKGNIDFSNTRFVPQSYFDNITPDRKAEIGDVLFTVTGSYGKAVLNKTDTTFCFQRHIALVKPLIYSAFVETMLNSPYIKAECDDKATGMAQKTVGIDTLRSFIVPLPPLAEQHRIVAKIEELLPKVEEYGKAQEALDKLNAELPDRLKKSVLQEAIEGRLVPQDPTDEPASVLLAKIRQEKEQLVKAGKLKKKDLIETPISEDEIPFEIPESWEWCRVKTILNVYSARRVHEKDWRSSGIPFYRAREIGKLADTGSVNNDLFIDKSLYEEFSKSGVPLAGDLMVTAVGTLGKTYIVKEGEVFYYKDGSVLCFNNRFHMDAKFLKYYIESPAFIDQYVNESQGTTVATLTMVRVNEYLIPLPPLAEQHRIVEKLEQVLGEIDKLKK